jgi:putative ABC transport system ATP-binding protein
MELIGELNRAGTTLVIITHEQAVADVCNTRVVMRDGQLVA